MASFPVLKKGEDALSDYRIDRNGADEESKMNLLQLLDKYSIYKWNYAKQILFEPKSSNLNARTRFLGHVLLETI